MIDDDELQVLDRLVERLIARCNGALSTCLAELGPPSPGLAAWLMAQPDIDLKLVLEHDPASTLCANPVPVGSSIEGSGASRPVSNSTVVWGPTSIESGRDLDLAWDEPETPYGHYTILKSIAKGGLGEVFVARDEGLNREVALKVIQSHLMKHALCRARFLIEAEITGILEHPGIVPVYALGHCEDGRPFYSMRLIHGQGFQEAIRRFHEEPDPEVRSRSLLKLLRHFIDVCNVVAYAHSRGVIHRDIKPANVMLGRYGETLLVDWGLAKRVDPPDPVGEREHWSEAAIELIAGSGVTPTAVGATVGTPRFMSPEQALGDTPRIGTRCDVYGLGATLYCLVAGQEPLEDVKDLQKVLERVVRGAIPPPRSFRHDASTTLETICLKAMAVRPEDRYASAGPWPMTSSSGSPTGPPPSRNALVVGSADGNNATGS